MIPAKNTRKVAIAFLIVGAALLFASSMYVRTIGGSLFIAGFMIFGLDWMRRSICKDE